MHRFPLPLAILALLSLMGCPPDSPVEAVPGTIPTSSARIADGRVGMTDYVIFSDSRRGILTAFRRENSTENNLLVFSPLNNGRPQEIMEDETGTVYNIFGEGTGGRNGGTRLQALPHGFAFWLVCGGLFPGAPLNEETIELPDSLELSYIATYDIPVNSLFTGAGFGVIAPLDHPEFMAYNRRTEGVAEGIQEDDLLVGISLNGDTRLYPAPILAAHEIVNDVVGGIPVAITYSPLSGSARVWRRPGPAGSQLGVTGMLANSAMLMFDREQEANRYHQITGRCVSGFCRDEYLEPVNYIFTSWQDWQKLVAEAKILLPSPGIDVDRARRMDARIKTLVPHGYPVDFFDDRLPEKEIVFGITDGITGETFTLDQFE